MAGADHVGSIVLDGVQGVLRNKGYVERALDGSMLLDELGFDSLDYAELLLHVEIITRVPVSLCPTEPIKTIADLAAHLERCVLKQ